MLTRLIILFVLTGVCGCASHPSDSAGTTPSESSSREQPAALIVQRHTGARAGSILAHISALEIDGSRQSFTSESKSFSLAPGRHELVVEYERCIHVPTLLNRQTRETALPSLTARVAFTAEAGREYTLRCSPGGAGLAIPNDHWIDERQPDGSPKRVSEGLRPSPGTTQRIEIHDATTLDRQ